MRYTRSKAAIGIESLEGRQLQTVLITPPVAPAQVYTELNPQPLPPSAPEHGIHTVY
jgi:hypothetical protein